MLVAFLPRIALDQRLIHDFGSKFSPLQNGHHLNVSFMLITTMQIPASLPKIPQDTLHNSGSVQSWYAVN